MLLLRCFVLSLAAVAGLWAQYTTQQISGYVRDASGAVVPAAKITATHIATDQTRAAASTTPRLSVSPTFPAATSKTRPAEHSASSRLD